MDEHGIVQMEDAPRRDVDAGPMGGTWWDIGQAGGSVTTGLRRIQVTPGRRATPAHAHDAEEEIFYVLAGAGLSWQDGRTCRVGKGDCIVHPAGGPAHTLQRIRRPVAQWRPVPRKTLSGGAPGEMGRAILGQRADRLPTSLSRVDVRLTREAPVTRRRLRQS